MASSNPTPQAPDAAEQPRRPADPSDQRRRRLAPPRSWTGPIAAFLLGAVVSGLITGAVVYSLNDDTRVVTRVVTQPPPESSTGSGKAAASAPCVEAGRLAQQQLDAVSNGLRQLGRADTTGLQQSIDRLQSAQPDLRKAAAACRSAVDNP